MSRLNVQNVRDLMKRHHLDAYIIPTDDYHGSEYVQDYFKSRQFISSFTGSAGTLVITNDQAGLWTDGRYFIQAKEELANTGITLFPMGEAETPDILSFLEMSLPEGSRLGFDGKAMSAHMGEELEQMMMQKKGSILYDKDLVNAVWDDRPTLNFHPTYFLEEEETGYSTADKIAALRKEMANLQADVHILTSLEDIAWLLNMRGSDISCTPVVLSFAVIMPKLIFLYCEESAFSYIDKRMLGKHRIKLVPYPDFHGFMSTFGEGWRVLLDKSKASYTTVKNLGSGAEIIDAPNPTMAMKAIKTPQEIANMRQAHIKDGIAVSKFVYWLKKQAGKEKITEISAAKKLEDFRKMQPGYLEPSFSTISAFGKHGAIVHYSVSKKSDIQIQNGFYLVDSGGQYKDGTTDITRTLFLGEPNQEEKLHYTLVVIAMLRVMNARVAKGSYGNVLDDIARDVLRPYGLDYNHGTGHGVGYRLAVHEGPNHFRKREPDGSVNGVPIKPGMITSDEPGLYLEDQYGIRMENLILCLEDEKDSSLLRFEPLTVVPIDPKALDVSAMTKEDLENYNCYQKLVKKTLMPHLTVEENQWLMVETKTLAGS